MSGSVFLAWRYLRYQRWKTLLLIASITLVLFVPAALQVLVQRSGERLTSRAEQTPLILGAKGSPLELVLSTLYFESRQPALITMSAARRVRYSGLADAIPLYVRFSARGWPLVGTTLEYFEFRGLRMARGRQLGLLGECVVGAEVARDLGLQPGSTLLSTPEAFFDLAGTYPLKMPVVGVLAPTGGPDDRAVFVDVKTSWVIQGLGHGHQDLSVPSAQDQVLRREGREVTGSPAVVQYQEITPANIASFHFHGDTEKFPLTAVLAVPPDQKSATLLLGRFQSPDERTQLVRPLAVIQGLMDTVFTIRSYVLAAAVLVGMATLLAVGLIFVLSVKLRQREIETLLKIGASRGRIAAILACEIMLTLVVSALIAALLTLLVAQGSDAAIRLFLL